jgi:hypothetical protein
MPEDHDGYLAREESEGSMRAKPIAPLFVHTATPPREPMVDRLESAIEQRRAVESFTVDEPTLPGLVVCDACGQSVQPRGNYFAVHFPSARSTRPCSRSWPPAVKR